MSLRAPIFSKPTRSRATPTHLEKWNRSEKAAEINRAGAQLARKAAAESGRQVFVAGSVGPTGIRLAPLGTLKPEEAREAFVDQIAALAEAGVDLLVLETFRRSARDRDRH